MKAETLDRIKAEKRYEKTRHKLEAKIEKVQPKIRDLTNRKAEMRS